MLKEFLTSIADKLRELLGTADTINAQNFTSKIDDVYDAGYEQGKSEGGGVQHSDYINPEWTDWRYFDYYDNRNSLVAKLKYSDTSKGTNFSYMFHRCSELQTIPELDTSNGTNFNYMFNECGSLTEIPELDTSNGTNFNYMFYKCSSLTEILELDTGKGITFVNMFNGCSSLTEIPELDTGKGNDFRYMFQSCNMLQTIPKLNLSSMGSSTNMADMFKYCSALENVTFEGTIKITSNILLFSNSSKLTVESLMSFINALSDNTSLSTTYTVTIGSTNLAKLTQEQIDIATAKNITLA